MRKKSLYLIPIVLTAVILTGCKNIKEAVTARTPDLNKAFACEFELTAFEDDRDEKMEVTGQIERLGTGMWKMDVASPESMAGLHIDYNDETVTATLGELTAEFSHEDINESAMFRMIFDSYDNCAAKTELTLQVSDENEGTSVYEGELYGSTYKMTFSTDTNELVSIEFPDEKVKVQLTFSQASS
jgi:hypothetical protein